LIFINAKLQQMKIWLSNYCYLGLLLIKKMYYIKERQVKCCYFQLIYKTYYRFNKPVSLRFK
jgi:hypothetical protein